MQTIAQEILSVIDVAESLRQIDEVAASLRPSPNKWSKKEILGHLIDSAANNHQRFVRLQLNKQLELPGYSQDDWVRLQHYQDRPWREIINLWHAYNTQLAHIVKWVGPEMLRNTWRTPDGSVVDLEFIARDYVTHMRHHLAQIL